MERCNDNLAKKSDDCALFRLLFRSFLSIFHGFSISLVKIN